MRLSPGRSVTLPLLPRNSYRNPCLPEQNSNAPLLLGVKNLDAFHGKIFPGALISFLSNANESLHISYSAVIAPHTFEIAGEMAPGHETRWHYLHS